MKTQIRFAALIISILQWWNLPAMAFSITSPKEGDVFRVGDTVVVTVETSSSELIHTVYFKSSISGLLAEVAGAFNKIEGPPFRTEFTIPRDFDISNPISIFAIGVRGQSPNDEEVRARPVNIRITLSPTVTLQSIRVDTMPRFLYLEPETSRTEELAVGGIFSDGVEREITSSALGTTYQSGNEKVVTVDKEGVLHAAGVGKTVITVKNGNKSVQIQVEVKVKSRFR